MRDLLQVANNGKLSFKNTAPQSYTIKTENCGDNAGMVKWAHDNVVTPVTEVDDIADIYLYGNIANCRFFVNDEEVAKPAYNKIYIKYLAIKMAAGAIGEGGGMAKIRLTHGYAWAGNTSIVLVIHAPNGNVILTETLQLNSYGKATSAGRSPIGNIAWVKHNTGLLRWVVSIGGSRDGRGW